MSAPPQRPRRGQAAPERERVLTDADVEAIADAVANRLRVLVARGQRTAPTSKRKRTPPAPAAMPITPVSDIDRARALGILRRNGLAR